MHLPAADKIRGLGTLGTAQPFCGHYLAGSAFFKKNSLIDVMFVDDACWKLAWFRPDDCGDGPTFENSTKHYLIADELRVDFVGDLPRIQRHPNVTDKPNQWKRQAPNTGADVVFLIIVMHRHTAGASVEKLLLYALPWRRVFDRNMPERPENDPLSNRPFVLQRQSRLWS